MEKSPTWPARTPVSRKVQLVPPLVLRKAPWLVTPKTRPLTCGSKASSALPRVYSDPRKFQFAPPSVLLNNVPPGPLTASTLLLLPGVGSNFTDQAFVSEV